jgi:hypothetical protein
MDVRFCDELRDRRLGKEGEMKLGEALNISRAVAPQLTA